MFMTISQALDHLIEVVNILNRSIKNLSDSTKILSDNDQELLRRITALETKQKLDY